MSKKTRKKSSKPSSKSRTTPARKPAAAKAARKTSRPDTAAAVKKPAKAATKGASKAVKPAAKETVKKPPKAAKTATKTTSSKSSHKRTPKQLIKSNRPAPAEAGGTSLTEGAMAPAFSLPRDGGGTVSLADYAGRKLVLFFYPRADTPGCTREAIDFTRLNDAFAEAGAVVLGISADTVKAQESFRDKHELSVPLISDQQHEMLEAFGAWGEKSMYGRTFMGIIRTTVLIGADGRIGRIWRNVRVDGHADEVLEAVRAL
ncbi:peroxiredoxin [Bradyrhizobium sp. BWA-3-5]|uniref:peroxiredoxin n=1 Tax=Bradyrhizobium sp. BWA-3-5 TaxID=3080013 RepID=UPI00293E4B4E|nr:peroxiredoxin [Bradyrhizobium sp. BWA-3-5]WOH69887.1 peroxiredoxin [Bradyrhizobium sp. BWA-3-5]